MLTFNRPQFIGRAIQSVAAQTFQGWELLVVQDGDNEQIAEQMGQWMEREPRIRYFHRLEPGNIANACNFALARALGDYIAILDDDDYWATPDKLVKQISFLDQHPEYVGCGGGVIVIDERGSPTMSYLKQQQDDDIKRNALYANPMAHSTTMFRKASANAVHGYEESLEGFQDWDLWLKLGKVGKLYNFPEPFLYYTIWSGGGSFLQTKANTRSAIRVVKRHWGQYPGSWLALGMAYLYHWYAHLPVGIKRSTFSMLSRMKKRIFSDRSANRQRA